MTDGYWTPGAVIHGMLLLLLFASSFVFMEPAPYDLLAGGLVLFLFISKLRIPPQHGFLIIALAVFLFANIISIAFGHDVDRSLFYFGVTFYLLLTWLMFSSLVFADPDRVIKTIWRGYVASAIVATVLGILGFYGISPPEPYSFATTWGRAKGAFKDPNVFAPFLVPAVVYLAAQIGNRGKIQAVLIVAMALFITLGVLIGFSRAAWGNYVVAFFVFALLRLTSTSITGQMINRFFLGISIVSVVAISIVAALSITSIGEAFAERAHFYQTYDIETGGRFPNMVAALELAVQNPFGIGPGHSELDLSLSTHNLYLRVLVENGWLALIALIGILIASIWRLFKLSFADTPHQKIVHVILASLVGAIGNSFVIDSLHWRHLFLILGIGWGLIGLYPVQPELSLARVRPQNR